MIANANKNPPAEGTYALRAISTIGQHIEHTNTSSAGGQDRTAQQMSKAATAAGARRLPAGERGQLHHDRTD